MDQRALIRRLVTALRKARAPQPMGSTEVKRVFDTWVQIFDRRKTSRLTDDRRRKIRARLREGYTPDELCQALRGAKKDLWLCEHGFTDLCTILKTAASVERHIQTEQQGAAVRGGIAPPSDWSESEELFI